MKVLELRASGFRNLETLRFSPCGGLNAVTGENAQGKTNLLEAMWLFTGGRSFRGARDQELVRAGAQEACLSLTFFSGGREQRAELTLRGGARQAVLNGVAKRGMAELIGRFCAVVFSPEHLSLVKGGPAERRAFLDSALCQAKPSYAIAYARYRRTLNQRNALLKDIARHPELEDTLPIWDDRLCRSGAVLIRERRAYLERFAPRASAHYAGIAHGREELRLTYEPSCGGDMAESLRRALREDIRFGHTSVGPHRDDIGIEIGGMAARLYASQGQQRSAVLAMKLAEAAVLAEACGEEPVVFLDDVLSELDGSRQLYLLSSLSGRQSFLTGCELPPRALGGTAARFLVRGGAVSPAEAAPVEAEPAGAPGEAPAEAGASPGSPAAGEAPGSAPEAGEAETAPGEPPEAAEAPGRAQAEAPAEAGEAPQSPAAGEAPGGAPEESAAAPEAGEAETAPGEPPEAAEAPVRAPDEAEPANAPGEAPEPPAPGVPEICEI